MSKKPIRRGIVEKLFPTCERCGRALRKCPGHERDENQTLGLPGTTGRPRQPRIKTRDTGKRFGR